MVQCESVSFFELSNLEYLLKFFVSFIFLTQHLKSTLFSKNTTRPGAPWYVAHFTLFLGNIIGRHNMHFLAHLLFFAQDTKPDDCV
jgi:hypothetical protein